MPVKFRLQPVLRWPLYLMNGFLLVALALLIGFSLFLSTVPETETPWTLTIWGAGITTVFFTVNWTIISVALILDENTVSLSSLLWRKRLLLADSTVEKIIRPMGLVGIRIRSANGDKLWLSASWFENFDRLHRDVEKYAIAAGGKATLAGR